MSDKEKDTIPNVDRLYSMSLHAGIYKNFCPDVDIIRVPGGWIYVITHKKWDHDNRKVVYNTVSKFVPLTVDVDLPF